jgi:hypothetical protein
MREVQTRSRRNKRRSAIGKHYRVIARLFPKVFAIANELGLPVRVRINSTDEGLAPSLSISVTHGHPDDLAAALAQVAPPSWRSNLTGSVIRAGR